MRGSRRCLRQAGLAVAAHEPEPRAGRGFTAGGHSGDGGPDGRDSAGLPGVDDTEPEPPFRSSGTGCSGDSAVVDRGGWRASRRQPAANGGNGVGRCGDVRGARAVLGNEAGKVRRRQRRRTGTGKRAAQMFGRDPVAAVPAGVVPGVRVGSRHVDGGQRGRVAMIHPGVMPVMPVMLGMRIRRGRCRRRQRAVQRTGRADDQPACFAAIPGRTGPARHEADRHQRTQHHARQREPERESLQVGAGAQQGDERRLRRVRIVPGGTIGGRCHSGN